MSNTFEITGSDPFDLRGKPRTVQTLIAALMNDDLGIHEPYPVYGTSLDDVYVCGCWMCQGLMPALIELAQAVEAA